MTDDDDLFEPDVSSHLADRVRDELAAEDVDRRLVEALVRRWGRQVGTLVDDPTQDSWSQAEAGAVTVAVLDVARDWAREQQERVPAAGSDRSSGARLVDDTRSVDLLRVVAGRAAARLTGRGRRAAG